jgi:hypothetical protein
MLPALGARTLGRALSYAPQGDDDPAAQTEGAEEDGIPAAESEAPSSPQEEQGRALKKTPR